MDTPLPRAAFDLEPGTCWLMHCAEGPVPLAAAAAAQELLGRELRPWRMRWNEDFLGLPRGVRGAAARLFGGRPDDVSLLSTTTSGLVAVAQGIPWLEGDEVLVPVGEFPTNAWPWRALARRGVVVREVPLWDGQRAGKDAFASLPPTAEADPEGRLLAALGPRTRLVAASWVRFQDGLRLDLARLAEGCARRGVTLAIDGIQGAGTLPLSLDDLPGLSAFASGGHKGLLGPQGIGLLWTNAAFRSGLIPPGNWLGVEQAHDFSRPNTDLDRGWCPDGSLLEQGVPALLLAAPFAASLELLAGAGAPRIAAHIASLQATLLEQLAADRHWRDEVRRLQGLLAVGRLGSVLAFHHQGDGPARFDQMVKSGAARGLFASAREGYLRVAFHGWHDETDVARALTWLQEAR